MGQPVARLGDVGSHGTIAIQGSGNVMTNGKPTHRLGDANVCPVMGHGMAVAIANCSATVLTNGKPTAHIGSFMTCGSVFVSGSPNGIVGG